MITFHDHVEAFNLVIKRHIYREKSREDYNIISGNDYDYC